MSSMKKFLLLIICSLVTSVFGQKMASGLLQNEKKEPIPFASVTIKGTSKGVKTTILGEFKISIPDTGNVSLIFSSVGYEKQEVLVKGVDPLLVTMVQVSKSLNEMVLVGYGSASKKELTGAISKIGGEELEKLNLSRMDQAPGSGIRGKHIDQFGFSGWGFKY